MDNIVDGIYYDFVWDNGQAIDLLEAIKNKNVDFHTVCIIGPEEHQPTEYYINKYEFDFFVGYCKQHKKKLKIILGANSNGYKEDVTIPWDTYVLNMTINRHVEKNVAPKTIEEFVKPFVSMNGRGHIHRMMFLDHMAKYNLFDKGFVSFHNFENVKWPNYRFKWWRPRRLAFDKDWFNPVDGYRDFLIPPEQFKTSLWSIVSESAIGTSFITEKTWIPIFHKRPFLAYAAPGFHRTLKEKYDIKMFDEIIDYRFDRVPNNQVRCDLLMQQVEKICNMDLQEQYNILKPKIEHNFKRIMELIQDPNLVDPQIRFYINKTNSRLEEYNRLLNIGSSKEFKNFLIQNNMKEYIK